MTDGSVYIIHRSMSTDLVMYSTCDSSTYRDNTYNIYYNFPEPKRKVNADLTKHSIVISETIPMTFVMFVIYPFP